MFSHREFPGANNLPLHVVTRGKGPLILFLHGFPEFWYAWKEQLEAFGSDYLAAALDMRGYNLSGKPRKVADYALTTLVEDIRCVVTALAPGKTATLVGHDWGGIVAWAFARAHPALLERLVIINAPHPALFMQELARNPAQRLASSYVAFFRLRWIAEAALSSFRFALLRKMIFGMTTRPEAFTPADHAAYRKAWSQPGALTGGLNYYRSVRTIREARKNPAGWRIRVPTLVLWGEADPALLTSNLHRLDEYVADLQILRHPTATHWVVHEEPEWVDRCIRNFLTAKKPEGIRAES